MSEIVLKYICPVSDIIFTEDFLFMRIQLSEHFTYRKLLRFTLPSVIMMVCTSIYGVVAVFSCPTSWAPMPLPP